MNSFQSFLEFKKKSSKREEGTPSLRKIYKHDTPGEKVNENQDLKSLYVKRDVLNTFDFEEYFQYVGLDAIPLEELHVTIMLSKTPVDWSKFEPNKNILIIDKDHDRNLIELGPSKSLVLTFKSPLLRKRWEYFRTYGCSWDYDDFIPHITFKYQNDQKFQDMIPYQGKIVLGEEQFKEVNF